MSRWWLGLCLMAWTAIPAANARETTTPGRSEAAPMSAATIAAARDRNDWLAAL